MLDHIHIMDKRLEDMCRGLKSLGAEVADLQMPDLDACELDSACVSQPIETGNESGPDAQKPLESGPDNS
jgi:serine O-acetyltransferase